MKNKLTDLNNHLFAQLERLTDEDLTPEQVASEVKRSGAIVDVADQIIKNADLSLKAAKLASEDGRPFIAKMLPMIDAQKNHE